MTTGKIGSDSKTESRPTICFSIVAGASDAFFSQVALFRLCLDRLGGKYAESRLFLFVGEESYDTMAVKWQGLCEHLTVIPVAPEEYVRKSYFAQVDARLLYPFYASDLVVFCDADTALLRPIDEALRLVDQSGTVAGVMAHYPPFDRSTVVNKQFWDELFMEFAGERATFSGHYTLLPNARPEDRAAPFYINYGVAIFHRDYLRKFAPLAYEYRLSLSKRLAIPFFCGQVALSLAVQKLGLGFHELPMEYNFPNDEQAEILYPEALEKLRLIHYMREERFSRSEAFRTSENFRNFLALRLKGSNRIFQAHVRALTGGQWETFLFKRSGGT